MTEPTMNELRDAQRELEAAAPDVEKTAVTFEWGSKTIEFDPYRLIIDDEKSAIYRKAIEEITESIADEIKAEMLFRTKA